MGEASYGRYSCAVEATMDVIGGKWKGTILFYLMSETRRFGELKRLMPTITHRMLTNQLRELERDGLINRVVYAQVPPKVEYSLTEFGASLKPIIMLMREWGEEYIQEVIVRREAAENQAGVDETVSEEELENA
jgi:DNA-binding HxlR family transcriptional regulator